jgi:hypothetical protein
MAEPTRRKLLLASALTTAIAIPMLQAQEKNMYKWLPSECAPQRYPVFLILGELFLADGKIVKIPDQRNVFNGWGQPGSIHIVGDAIKPVPVRLELRWFAYAEDQFYQGQFDLPHQLINDLFKAGVAEGRHLHARSEFEGIVVGMAPGGWVSVWLTAGAETVEVASFHAEPVELPWTSVSANAAISRPVYIERRLTELLGADGREQLRREGVPLSLFAEYHRRYRWVPRVNAVSAVQALRIISFNGENAAIGPAGPAVPRNSRAVPAMVEVDWTPPDGGPKTARITFDETETFAAFRKLSQGDDKHSMTLDIDAAITGASAALRDQQYLLPLHRLKVKIFSR